MLRTLGLVAIFGTTLLSLPVSAQADTNSTVDINQEFNAFKKDFQSDPQVLTDALEAYDCGIASGDVAHPDILTVVDYSLPSFEKRLWVLDLADHQVLYYTYVAHGAGSGKVDATRFSNDPQSDESSIGLYETGNSYFGDWGYSMRLYGLEEFYNSNAFRRAIVMHGGKYVSNQSIMEYGMIGMSDGCLAVPINIDRSIIDTIKNGSLIFAYYPSSYWLATSRFLHCSILKRLNG